MTRQGLFAPTIGLMDAGDVLPNSNQTGIDAAGKRIAFGFQVAEAKTLNKVQVYCTFKAGVIISTDLVAELWSLTAGASPTYGTLLESRATLTSAAAANQWLEFNGFTTALSAGVSYAIVFKNVNAVPGTNYVFLRYIEGVADHTISGTNPTNATGGWNRRTSADSGTSWTTLVNRHGIQLLFSDGSYEGMPIYVIGPTQVGEGVYSTRESGAKFVSPSGAKLRVKGVGARLSVTGTPTGQPRFRLYSGSSPSLLGTTVASPVFENNQILTCFFATTIELAVSTIHRVVLGESTQSDASTNRFNLLAGTTDGSAASRLLMPLGQWEKTYYDGSSWTDVTDTGMVIWLILEEVQPFGAASAGSLPFAYGFA